MISVAKRGIPIGLAIASIALSTLSVSAETRDERKARKKQERIAWMANTNHVGFAPIGSYEFEVHSDSDLFQQRLKRKVFREKIYNDTLFTFTENWREAKPNERSVFYENYHLIDFDGLYAALSNRAKNKRGIPDVDTLKAIYEEGDYYLQVANYDLNNDGVKDYFFKVSPSRNTRSQKAKMINPYRFGYAFNATYAFVSDNGKYTAALQGIIGGRPVIQGTSILGKTGTYLMSFAYVDGEMKLVGNSTPDADLFAIEWEFDTESNKFVRSWSGAKNFGMAKKQAFQVSRSLRLEKERERRKAAAAKRKAELAAKKDDLMEGASKHKDKATALMGNLMNQISGMF